MPLILSPRLQSRILKQQSQCIHFFVWTSDVPHVSSIELWSNLHEHKTWRATSFTRVADDDNSWYQLTLPLVQPCGTYEYTLRYWKNGQEVWLGTPYENGVISILPSINQSPPPPPPPPLDLTQHTGHFLTLVDSRHHQRHTWSWIYKIEKRAGQHWIPLLKVDRMHSYMALARKSSCWLVPVSGSTHFEYDARPWQLFVYRNSLDGKSAAWMVRTCKNQDALLHVNTTTSVLELYTDQQHDSKDHESIMYLVGSMTSGTDDNAIKSLVSALILESQHQQRRGRQGHGQGLVGTMHDYLGYCTWNSLGQHQQQDMNMTGLIKALDSFAQHEIPIGYLILDDGWQEQHDGYLAGFDADPHKFPDGLSGTIKLLKQRYPSLKTIGVWHALWGYWFGVGLASSIGKLYSPIKSYYSSCSDTLSVDGDAKAYQIVFEKIHLFYDDFYRHLADKGVDMVKIDYQGCMGDLRRQLDSDNNKTLILNLKDRHQLWGIYHVAAARAMEKYFTTPPLHCMALNPHLLDCWNLAIEEKATICDDFFPDVIDSHPWHIYGNLLNSMWSSSFFSVVDFDMFQSGHPYGEYHATSRAISGGPIYITDVPGNHDADLIKTLVAENRQGQNQILRCTQTCWPLYDTILGGKPVVDQDYIGAWNTIGTFGFIYGYWNMQKKPHQCIVTTPIPLGYVGYVSSGLDIGKWMYNLESKDDLLLAFRLGSGGCSLVRVVPVYGFHQPSSSLVNTGAIGCLGLLDKLIGLQPIIYTKVEKVMAHDKTYLFKISLSHRSSQCGFVLLSPTTNLAATILWARMDGVDVKLKKQSRNPQIITTHQTSVWMLDMTQVSLVASNTLGFSIEICISY